VFVPPVNIQAPVVLAAFSSPLRISCESNRNQFQFQDATAIQLACDTRPFLEFLGWVLGQSFAHLFQLGLQIKVGLAALHGDQKFWQFQIPFLGE